MKKILKNNIIAFLIWAFINGALALVCLSLRLISGRFVSSFENSETANRIILAVMLLLFAFSYFLFYKFGQKTLEKSGNKLADLLTLGIIHIIVISLLSFLPYSEYYLMYPTNVLIVILDDCLPFSISLLFDETVVSFLCMLIPYLFMGLGIIKQYKLKEKQTD